MRMIHLPAIAIASILLITSCSTPSGQTPTQTANNFIHKQKVVVTAQENYPAKNPEHVAFYNADKTPHMAYRVIGVATISKYNLLGMQRQEATLNEMMKKIAASIGGDGVINVSSNPDNIQASIIAFQKILI